MNVEEKNSILSLFRKWLSGDTRRSEEEQLDNLAADDPFVAEAMEGFRRFPEGDHARDVTRLKANLRKRYQKDKRRGAFYLYRVAASVAILIIAVGGFWMLNRNGAGEKSMAVQDSAPTEQTESAANENTIEALPPVEETAPVAADVTEEVIDEKEPPRIAASKEKTTLAQNKPAEKPEVSEPQSPEEDAQNSTEIAIVEPPSSPAPPKDAASPVPAPVIEEKEDEGLALEVEEDVAADYEEALSRKKIIEPAQARTSSISSRTIKGDITDDSGEPLIGVNILVVGTNIGTVTDFDGHYSLDVPEEGEELVISYTGYSEQLVQIGSQSEVNVVLDGSDLALNEVVVTGYGVESRKESAGPVFARPSNGYKDLKQYIKDNLNYPQAAKENGIEGKVKLRFKVNPNGRLGDFKVLRSLGYGCDEEAIRLLQNGPPWEISSGGKALTKTYVVKFDLP